jgi:hypothetical protein
MPKAVLKTVTPLATCLTASPGVSVSALPKRCCHGLFKKNRMLRGPPREKMDGVQLGNEINSPWPLQALNTGQHRCRAGLNASKKQ